MCGVPPLSLNSVRFPHPSVNIWTHFLVRCPPLILSSMWCYVRCPSLILNSTHCPNLFVCGVFRPKSILELYPTPNSSFSIWHDTLKWNVNLAQLVSSSVALPAKLVILDIVRDVFLGVVADVVVNVVLMKSLILLLILSMILFLMLSLMTTLSVFECFPTCDCLVTSANNCHCYLKVFLLDIWLYLQGQNLTCLH